MPATLEDVYPIRMLVGENIRALDDRQKDSQEWARHGPRSVRGLALSAVGLSLAGCQPTCSTAARVARRCVQRLAVRGWGVGVEGGEAEFGPGIEQPSVAGGGGEVLLS